MGTLRRYDALERDAAEGRAAVAAEWRCEWDALAEEEAKVRVLCVCVWCVGMEVDVGLGVFVHVVYVWGWMRV